MKLNDADKIRLGKIVGERFLDALKSYEDFDCKGLKCDKSTIRIDIKEIDLAVEISVGKYGFDND